MCLCLDGLFCSSSGSSFFYMGTFCDKNYIRWISCEVFFFSPEKLGINLMV